MARKLRRGKNAEKAQRKQAYRQAYAAASAELRTPYREPPDRPRVNYTFDLSERICERLACGETATAICRDPQMPTYNVLARWLEIKPDFRRRYERARLSGYEYWADDAIDIADTPQEGVTTTTQEWGTSEKRADMLEHRRLRIDVRKWELSKRARHVYGERQELAHTTPDGVRVEVAERNALIDSIVKLISPKADGPEKPDARREEGRER